MRERIAAAGADPAAVEICAAIKYVAAEELPALAEAGIELVGENRAQDLLAQQRSTAISSPGTSSARSRAARSATSRRAIRLIHSVASDSALRKLEARTRGEVLVEVNVAGEEGKAGIAPAELGDFIGRAPVPVTGLMTMPPAVARPEDNRRHFARLAELAGEHGLARLSMGTTQDFEVAAAEGATIVRLGSVLYEGASESS